MILPLFSIPQVSEAQPLPVSGSVEYAQNNIKRLRLGYDDFSFVVSYKQYYMRIRPFVIWNGTYYGMKQIVTWLQANYPQVSLRWLAYRFKEAIHYGFNLTKLPQDIADKLDYLGFRLVDLNFPLSALKVKVEEVWDYENGIAYNVTRLFVPKVNLAFSFEDLYPYGYSVEHVNKTYVLIGNVRGRTDLLIDPIVYSGTEIKVTGYNMTHPCTFEDLWDADNAGELELLANTTATVDLSLTTQVQPADDLALNLTLVVSGFVSDADSEYLLYVDAFSEATGWTGWTRTGASPYIDAVDNPTNTIDTGAQDGIGNFTFANMSGSPSVVLLDTYCYASGNDDIEVEVWNGTSWILQAINPTNSYSWITWNVTTILTTEDQVNNAEVRFTHKKVAGTDHVYIDACRLNVTVPAGYPWANVTGTDKDGNAQTEAVDVSGGNGNYTTSSYFRSVDANGLDCSGAYGIAVYQDQWGAVYKWDSNNYRVDATLVIGDSVVPTSGYFGDENVTVTFALSNDHIQNAYGNVTLGRLIENGTDKLTAHGVTLIQSYDGTTKLISSSQNCPFYLYSCKFIAYGQAGYLELGADFEMYNCYLEGCDLRFTTGNLVPDIYCLIQGSSRDSGFAFFTSGTLLGSYVDLLFHSNTWTFYSAMSLGGMMRDVRAVNNTYIARFLALAVDFYAIDVQSDSWLIDWAGTCTAEFWRQYSFNLRTIFLNQSSAANANVTLTDVNSTVVYSGLTDSNGEIPEQIVTAAFYNQTGGNTPYSRNPYNLTISLGDSSYQSIFNITERQDLLITLQVAGDVLPEWINEFANLPLYEVIIFLVVSMFFSTLFLVQKAPMWGYISFVCWLILGMLWLFIQPISYFVSMMFFAIGLILLILAIILQLEAARMEKKGLRDGLMTPV